MNRRLIVALALLGVAATLAGVIAARMLGGGGMPLKSGTWLPARRSVADFHLQDGSGKDFGLQQLQGHPTLLFFGFTSCPDVCPLTLQTLAQTEHTDALPGAQVVFVSIDPQRDSAATLNAYLKAFSGDFVGVRGDEAALAPLLRSLGAIAVKQPLGEGNYTMDHSATLYLLDTHGRLAAVFSPPFKVAGLTEDFRHIASAGVL
jgi:protein SCO1/2